MGRPPADDIGLWRRAMRDVAPLPGRQPPPRPRPDVEARAHRSPAPRSHKDMTEAGSASSAKPRPQAPPLDRFAGVDRATAERVRRGRYPIAARLDLHGLTQAEAHRALAGFVSGARGAGHRCVLVITGHGRLSGGVLKAAVPRWLAEPDLRRHVLALASARPQDGGAGALYLLLRKPP